MEVKTLRKQGESLRDIATRMDLSVNTVRKYLREGPPKFRKGAPRESILDPFKDYLQERVSAAHPDWIPATVLLREITARGYPGCLRVLQHYLKRLRPAARPDPVVRFETAPGQQLQIDWIEFRKSGHRHGMLAAFVGTLGYSRASYVEFVTDMQLETLLACHTRALEFFGGVPREVLYDNMKTVILKRDAYGRHLHRYQPTFADFAHHYGFIPRVCRPYRAKTKGKVERMNGYLRRSFWIPLAARCKQLGTYADCDTANREVRSWLRDVANARVHGTTGAVPATQLEIERTHLLALPAPYVGKTARQLTLVSRGPKPIPAQAWQTLQHPLSVYDALAPGMKASQLHAPRGAVA